jgi:D-inositol-3-phosphate glycosyltransferase
MSASGDQHRAGGDDAADARQQAAVGTAGADKPQGRIIERLLGEHPGISVVANCKTPATMAALMADHDIVVMPSNSQYWHETFGIVSIEAQHSGCRVVASDDGGLPETDCGGVVLVRPDNAEAFAWGIREAVDSGPLSVAARHAEVGRRLGWVQPVSTVPKPIDAFPRQPLRR